ncbi:MAG: hypothetical protein IIC60_06765 [Proteobacteria bacterium]|nr:hypothetical protein [Pseudomonadota bacterium]
MPKAILKKIRQQVMMLLVVALVLTAAYVSAGRQFMPAVSGYTAFFEEQIFALTGLPVSIESVTGSFEGFNPIIRVNGLSLLVPDGQIQIANPAASALGFNSALLIVDIPRSLWQRRWVLEDFVVETLEINVEQTESGGWQLSGLSIANGASVDLNSIYQSLMRVSRLDLRNVAINIKTQDGNTFSFNNGLATIQNRGQTHYLHVNANLEENSQQIAFSFEVEGNDLADIDGWLHVTLPAADYSDLFSGQKFGRVAIQQIIGGGDFWIAFDDGQISEIISDAKVDSVTLLVDDSELSVLNNIRGTSSLKRGMEEGHWELALADMSVSWEELDWTRFNAYLYWAPGQSITARADNIDISMLSQFAVRSGLLNDDIRQQVELYSPRGALENLSLYLPLSEDSDEHMLLKTNLVSVDVASVLGSPAMWGLNGYVEVDYDNTARQAIGLAEVESEEFRINIPNIFTDTWDFDYANGSLGFRLDLAHGQMLKIVSSVIVAKSELIDGRVQFSSTLNRPLEGERESQLELLVGALRLDAAQKSLVLPNAPKLDAKLKTTMQWLDRAILGGEVRNSGVIFRGSTLQGSAAASKTFQSFYLMSAGELSFSDDWPDLQELSALVITDDNNIDIEVLSGSSMGIKMGHVIGEIRRNNKDENWVSIHGQVAGATARGLAYLQNAPVGEGLKNTFANWETEGDFVADIKVAVPLNRSEYDTDVRLDITFKENKFIIPEYALEVEHVSGPIIYDTTTGLEHSELTGLLFDHPVIIKLSSQSIDGDIQTIFVDALGSATPAELIDWPLQSSFVRDLLSKMDGQFNYAAHLRLDQGADRNANNTLVIDSSLVGAALSLPHPFTKSAEEEMVLHLELEFGESDQHISGTLGAELAFDLELQQGQLNDGTVYLGENYAQLRNLASAETEGLAIIGEMDRFHFEQWISFLDELNSVGSPASDLSNSIAFVDIAIEVLQIFDQELPNVALRIEGNAAQQAWNVGLSSEAVQGQINIPYAENGYIELNLDYLRLPGDPEEVMPVAAEDGAPITATREDEPKGPRIDALAQVDPRDLPKMKIDIGEFRIGERPYGSWQFTLDPTTRGAEFSDLSFDFRGLRAGMGKVEQVAADVAAGSSRLLTHFSWRFDGIEHHSELSGVLYADDLADVLTANGYADSLESSSAVFITNVNWPGTPAFFAASTLSGELAFEIEDGRFEQGGSAAGALKLISIINFDAIMRRLRFSDDLFRDGLAYDEITGAVMLENGLAKIEDRLVISGPSSLYQITGEIDLVNETILGEMYVTLPVGDNIPWIGLLTGNLPLAVGAYLFDRIFGGQVDSLTSAVYTLNGPWEGLQPEFKQAFGSPDDNAPQSGSAIP